MTSLRPRMTVDDALDLRAGHAKAHRELVERERWSHGSNLIHLFFRQLRLAVTGSRLDRAVPTFVGAVVGARSPRKVFKRVVQGIAVKMSRFVTLWTWASECGQHDPVDCGDDRPAVTPKRHLFIEATARHNGMRRLPSPWSVAGIGAMAGPHLAHGAHGISSEVGARLGVDREFRYVHSAHGITGSHSS